MPVVGSVRAIASDLCFLGDIQLQPFMRMGSKVLWFFRQSNNSKTIETTKNEQLLQEVPSSRRLPTKMQGGGSVRARV